METPDGPRKSDQILPLAIETWYLADYMIRVDFITLFPEMIEGALSHSIMSRAVASGQAEFRTSNPRDFATDNHRTVDDTSYGGGPGMVMMAPRIKNALDAVEKPHGSPVILCDPAGEPFTQAVARELGSNDHLTFVCGHYEGVDERVRTELCTHAYSIGDYVLTGGEIPALVMTDAVVRLREGVLGDPESHEDDSHTDGLLGFPLYTRPEVFEGVEVPAVLKSGNHAEIAKWRRKQQLLRTRKNRPDLFSQADLKPDDLDLL